MRDCSIPQVHPLGQPPLHRCGSSLLLHPCLQSPPCRSVLHSSSGGILFKLESAYWKAVEQTVKSLGFGVKQIWSLRPFANGVTLGKWLHLFKPQFSYLQNWNRRKPYLTGWQEGMTYVKSPSTEPGRSRQITGVDVRCICLPSLHSHFEWGTRVFFGELPPPLLVYLVCVS